MPKAVRDAERPRVILKCSYRRCGRTRREWTICVPNVIAGLTK